MSHQDWKIVSWDKTEEKTKTTDKVIKNKQNYIEKKKDPDDNEIIKTEKITTAFKVELQKYRTKANISQKDLANRLNLPISIIKDYESGKCEPNGNIIQSMEKLIIMDLTKNKSQEVPKIGFLNALRKKV